MDCIYSILNNKGLINRMDEHLIIHKYLSGGCDGLLIFSIKEFIHSRHELVPDLYFYFPVDLVPDIIVIIYPYAG